MQIALTVWPAHHPRRSPGETSVRRPIVTLCQYILLVLIRVYSSVEPKFCDRYSLFVICIGTLSNEFTRFEQSTATLV